MYVCLWPFLLALHPHNHPRYGSCSAYNWILTGGSAIVTYTMELCLTVRVHAMYGANRRLLYFNLIFLGCTIAADVFLAIFGLPKFKYITAPTGQAGCYSDGE